MVDLFNKHVFFGSISRSNRINTSSHDQNPPITIDLLLVALVVPTNDIKGRVFIATTKARKGKGENGEEAQSNSSCSNQKKAIKYASL